MKYITAIIQPDRMDDVLAELERNEIHYATVTPVLGRGRQRGISTIYRSHKEVGSLLKKTKLEIALPKDKVQTAIDAITKAARSGNIGDGKIFIMDMEECIRIRTAEKSW
ncbi:MAG: P-II family nitrogen regulator [Lentisphaerota bacterium]